MRRACYSLMLLILLPGVGLHAEPSPKAAGGFSSWVVYWDVAPSVAAALRTRSTFDEVCVFAYHFDRHGRLVPASPAVLALRNQIPRRSTLRTLITVVNDVETAGRPKIKDPEIVHQILSHPARRRKHREELLRIADLADGLEVDYERVRFEDQKAFTEFVRDLSQALRPRGKKLSVVVQPRTTAESQPALKRNGAETIDWKAISPWVDRVKVMAYHYHSGGTAPGSIAPIDWVEQIAAYGVSQAPVDKLVIVLHVGGFDWVAGGAGKSIEFGPASSRASRAGVKIDLDSSTQSGHFQYMDEKGSHTVWIETAQGLRAKIDRLHQKGIRHIGFWRFGTGDPALWDSL